MTSNNKIDYGIVGAGAAGLWLALELDRGNCLTNRKLIIFEENAQKGDDRTWCFWSPDDVGDSVIKNSVSHSWSRVSYSCSAKNSISISPYRYYYIRSSDFYEEAKRVLNKNPNIEFVYESVEDYTSTDVGIELKTGTGQKIMCEKVFTSAFKPFYSLPQIHFWQTFAGRRVKFEKEVFDNRCFTLMDFGIPQGGATQFLYVLPTSKTEALIEVTKFGKEDLDREFASQTIEKAVKTFDAGYRFIDEETGKIPMSLKLESEFSTHPDARIIPIGTVSGAIKATTGYGFLEMRNRAKVIAQGCISGNFQPFRQSARFKFYDQLLLTILKEEPQRGKEVFTSLLYGTPPQKVFKFLSEKTSIFEDLHVFSSLPVTLFLKHLVKLNWNK